MTLYSYCLLYDTGAAPNPFWGVCTLVICKPQIRLHAQINDWIVGLGSKDSSFGDRSTEVIYAMKVTDIKTMQEYDQHCMSKLPGKIPDVRSTDYRRRVGDCIYDYSSSDKNPKQRESVHDQTNLDTDLRGKFALISNHFWYFGNEPKPLPKELLGITHPHPGHKSKANTSYIPEFVEWIENFDNKNYIKCEPKPELKSDIIISKDCRGKYAKEDKTENENDEITNLNC